jgi:hypothetical protein
LGIGKEFSGFGFGELQGELLKSGGRSAHALGEALSVPFGDSELLAELVVLGAQALRQSAITWATLLSSASEFIQHGPDYRFKSYPRSRRAACFLAAPCSLTAARAFCGMGGPSDAGRAIIRAFVGLGRRRTSCKVPQRRFSAAVKREAGACSSEHQA